MGNKDSKDYFDEYLKYQGKYDSLVQTAIDIQTEMNKEVIMKNKLYSFILSKGR